MYVSFLKSKNAMSLKINPEVFWTHQFRSLLNTFYDEVIKGVYGYKIIDPGLSAQNLELSIQRIRPGDTRHFAFCSMMLQGFNPLTIMRIGGHSKIYTQRGYYNHLDTFVDDNVINLAQEINRALYDRATKIQVYNHVFNNRETIVNKMWLIRKREEGFPCREIDDGLCFSQNFPLDCPPNTHHCILCNQFLLDMDDADLILTKTETLCQELSSELYKNIQFLKEVLTQTLKEDATQQAIIKQTSEQLTRLIAQKSIITAYRMNARE